MTRTRRVIRVKGKNWYVKINGKKRHLTRKTIRKLREEGIID